MCFNVADALYLMMVALLHILPLFRKQDDASVL